MPTAVELNKYFDEIIPASLGFNGDSGGISLLAGNNNASRIVVALDVTTDTLNFAHSIGAEIVVTHHPAIFGSINSIRCDDAVGMRLLKAASYGISLLAYHTRLDNAPSGVNETLCDLLEIKDYTEFAPCARLGKLASFMPINDFADMVSEKLCSDRMYLIKNKPFAARIAVCSGGGSDIVRDAYLAGADTVVTGESKYNFELDAKEYGINLITAGHKETEQIVLPVLKEMILKGFPETEVFEYYA